jgi:hypothetical protein
MESTERNEIDGKKWNRREKMESTERNGIDGKKWNQRKEMESTRKSGIDWKKRNRSNGRFNTLLGIGARENQENLFGCDQRTSKRRDGVQLPLNSMAVKQPHRDFFIPGPEAFIAQSTADVRRAGTCACHSPPRKR